MNRTLEQWAAVKPDAFLTGSIQQARNVIEMMQQDIAALGDAQSDMAEALRHAEAILSVLPNTTTNKNGAGPTTSTALALEFVSAALMGVHP